MLAIAERTSSNRPPATLPSIAAPSRDGFFRLRGQHGLSRRVREQLPNQIESPGTAADHHPLDRRTGHVLRFDDLAKAVTGCCKCRQRRGRPDCSGRFPFQGPRSRLLRGGRPAGHGFPGTPGRHAGPWPAPPPPTSRPPPAPRGRRASPARTGPRAPRRRRASGAAGCIESSCSIAAPATDCPPSLSHTSGTIAEK